MKAPRIIVRTKPLPGMSVRETAQASGTAIRVARTVTVTPYRIELPSAIQSRAWP
jgi:hypothetical protein